MANNIITNALLLDKLLDKWDPDNADSIGTYFQSIVRILPAPANAPVNLILNNINGIANLGQLKEAINKLYLVFHYPQKDTIFNNALKIDDTQGVFNYVLPTNGNIGKRLLSSTGIVKKDMVNLKMVIDNLAKAPDDTNAIRILLTDTSNDIVDSQNLKMGGNNTTDIFPKNTGGKNNKSNKRIKKPRRKNKSSKSLR
jgi:hypothetical protein